MRKIASSVLVSAALSVIFAAPATAQQRTAAEEADHVKTLIEEAKTRLAQQGQTPSPAQAGTTTGPKIALTADEAVARALERNVTLASAAPDAADLRLRARGDVCLLSPEPELERQHPVSDNARPTDH